MERMGLVERLGFLQRMSEILERGGILVVPEVRMMPKQLESLGITLSGT